MDRSNIIELVTRTYTHNADYQQIETETRRTVYCSVNSVTLNEWNIAGQNGRKPQYRMTMFIGDYNNEETLIYNRKYYSIYRTYIGKNETIDLYVEEKVGTNKTYVAPTNEA